MRPKEKRHLLEQLAELYPDPKSELHFADEYQLLIAVMLSAQCTDKKVNEVTPILFTKYNNFKELAKAHEDDVATIIRPINYFKTKSRNCIATAKLITEQFKGGVPSTPEELTSLPGVGSKTANVIMCELGHRPAFPVDTHVFRLAHRLGLSEGKNPDAVEADLCKAFKPEEWRNLHHRFIFHGRRVCKAQRPECAGCALRGICPSAQ